MYIHWSFSLGCSHTVFVVPNSIDREVVMRYVHASTLVVDLVAKFSKKLLAVYEVT